MSGDKGASTLPNLSGDANYRIWAFKTLSFIKERYPDLAEILKGLDNKKAITEEDMEGFELTQNNLAKVNAELYSLL
eukprot:5590476-Karenia_brevis.AAC.1